MIQTLLELEFSDMARFNYESLKAEDRRALDVKFAHLQNWWNDDFAREHSEPIKLIENGYRFQTSDNEFVVAFELTEKKIIIIGIFSKDTLRRFNAAPERTTS